MKKIIYVGLALATIAIGCKQETKPAAILGVHKMDKQVVFDGKTESVATAAEGLVQYKIYTPEGYFYIKVTKDSAVAFGTGSYTQTGNTVTETNIFNSGSLDTAWSAKVEVEAAEKGYNQIVPELNLNGVKYKLTENYTTVASTGTSPLDGIWHQTKTILISGKDTADKTYNEYKVYNGGHFMWATKYTDEATKKEVNLVGHGTFTLNNESLTEQLDMSSRKDILGKYDIKVKFNGPDEYTQETADTVAKTVNFKTYKRLKK
jgi:hypothetical protein